MGKYIFENEYLSLRKKDNGDGYILSMYDKHGHYLDDVEMDTSDVIDMEKKLEENKNIL